SVPRLRADMREAEKVERFRPAETPRSPTLGGEPSELDQACLLGRQLQPEPREPFLQLGLEPLRILTMLKAHDEVIGKPHDDHVAARMTVPPLLGPEVEDVVQVDVCKQR